jgi:mannose-6-phosphate isomerase
MTLPHAFNLQPEYRDYVWGGQRLRPGQLTAEAWIVYEGDEIESGPWAGLTLGEAAAAHSLELLGRKPLARTGQRFPLLIKLLDCAQWLSVQVHPNDQKAVELEGPGQFGKTEAWHFFETEPGAEILAGMKAGTRPDDFVQAVRAGGLLDVVQHVPVSSGDTVFIPAGMVHALGPGMLLYEVQQTSNITYRVFDWNRPASDGRPLHIEQSLAVTDLSLAGQVIPAPAVGDGERCTLLRCPYFTLELLAAARKSIAFDTTGESFHIVTLTQGSARLSGAGWSVPLAALQTALIPAAAGKYRLEPQGETCKALLAYVD